LRCAASPQLETSRGTDLKSVADDPRLLGTSGGPHVVRAGDRPARVCTPCAPASRPPSARDLRNALPLLTGGQVRRPFAQQPSNDPFPGLPGLSSSCSARTTFLTTTLTTAGHTHTPAYITQGLPSCLVTLSAGAYGSDGRLAAKRQPTDQYDGALNTTGDHIGAAQWHWPTSPGTSNQRSGRRGRGFESRHPDCTSRVLTTAYAVRAPIA
jgi:hypothetical protein